MIDCISMWQPWATWVEKEWKKTETRRHNRLACLAKREKRIAIHAAQKWDPDWRDKAGDWLSSEQYDETDEAEFNFLHIEQYGVWPRGALICTVFPAEHARLSSVMSPLALCDCSGNDLYGIVLEDVQRFRPIKWTGHQGIMKVPEEVIERAKE